MNDGVNEGPRNTVRRRTVLTTALGAVPVALAGGVAGGGTASAAPGDAPASDRSSVTGLTVEHRTDPLGVDAETPRFGWRMASAARGRQQSAYRILVATSAERLRRGRADVWDSGRVTSPDSVAVRYAGDPLRRSTRYFWTVRVWDERDRRVADAPTARFETGLKSTDGISGWDGARWITMAGKRPNTPGAPLLRRQAALRGRVREARLYVSALGVYDAYVNGRRVAVPHGRGSTLELLTPGWTNYDSTVSYFTYDVTDLIGHERQVTLAAVLGNGWYNGRISDNSAYYAKNGNRLALKAKLLIHYADGSTQTVVTAPGADWRATDTGPYRADDIYDGQTYDARKELRGWTENGFDTSAWASVEEHDFATRFPDSRLVAYPGESARLTPEWDRRPRSVAVHTGVTGAADSPNGKGRIVVDPDRTTVTDVTLHPGETAVFDLGQNMVGVPRYTLRGPEGAEVTLRFGEMLNDDSKGADGPEGSLYRANLRTAKATSTYVLKGDPDGETHQDSLTFYGFRYASVTTTATVTLTELTGRVATSALTDIGTVTTDDHDVNQLISNVRWGQRGNYLWIPTDCPQRDERCGWTGDTQLFSNTGLYNADAVNFLSHFQDILIDSQRVYGADKAQFTWIAPGARYNAPVPASGWADCGVVVPWTVWQMSGDSTVVERSWDAMTAYLDWIRARTGDTYAGQGAIFGDWLAFQDTSTQLMSDVYYGYSARLMADMARATGRTAEGRAYDDLFSRIKRAFIAKYVVTDADTGRITVRSSLGEPPPTPGDSPRRTEDDSQTALLWMLKLGFYDTEAQRRQLVTMLAENIGNDAAYKAAHPDSTRVHYAENTLAVGFLGVNVLAPVLTDEGRVDLAYRLLHQDAMPSWLYSVRNGATTVWERWNSYSEEDGFGPVDMNSFNHYSYGAIMEWMYESMAGIAKDPAHPGFRHFHLRPHLDPTGRIRRVTGSHLSPYGEIVSEWKADGRKLTYRAAVPANTTATLRIPTTDPSTVREGRTPLAKVEGVEYLGFEGGTASYRLPSGRYELTSALA
ncbi:family 78 glycoside hydrolase catalytic domain [Streptomyces spinoverrucosus]|uniref:alpha-L-rhamnosidase n=1 Tax=Streptomyces spinoverrucosus TaxID=284043 RepID=UPI0018C3F6C3|nr:alpha-L-rhamnosidase [Streptomyces spinoverrucosus]MBG0850757.1 family 78 glycoside hydrolase catalytic domain [Streptomyces spinoverrucosus]